MRIGYLVEAEDDGSYMLGEDSYRPAPNPFHDWRFGREGVPHPATCAGCGRKTDPDFVSPTFRARRRRQDLSTTVDGYTLSSRRVRDFCLGARFPGVTFVALPADPDFFWMRSDRVVAFDAEARGTRFEVPCGTCGAFYSVVGATPVLLRNLSAPLPEGFHRTDLEFGSGPEQSAHLLASLVTGEALAAERLKGLELLPITADRR